MQAIVSPRSLWLVGLDAVVVALDLVPCLQIRHCLTRIGYFLRQKWPVTFFFVHLQIPHGEGDQYQSDENVHLKFSLIVCLPIRLNVRGEGLLHAELP
jgi:hypothetical protein